MTFKVKIYGLLTAILMPFLLFVQMCDSDNKVKGDKKIITEVQTEQQLEINKVKVLTAK